MLGLELGDSDLSVGARRMGRIGVDVSGVNGAGSTVSIMCDFSSIRYCLGSKDAINLNGAGSRTMGSEDTLKWGLVCST